jgi:hypothetical protein
MANHANSSGDSRHGADARVHRFAEVQHRRLPERAARFYYVAAAGQALLFAIAEHDADCLRNEAAVARL